MQPAPLSTKRHRLAPAAVVAICVVLGFGVGSGAGFVAFGGSDEITVAGFTTVPDTTVPKSTVPKSTVPDTTVPDTTVPDTTVPNTTVPESTVAGTDTAPPDVSGFPSGLLCADLVDAGLGYAAAYAYWDAEDFPARMDEDSNGVPCESRYAPAEINDFLGLTGAPTFDGVEHGRLCRDLFDMGFTFAESYRYWVWDGQHPRMDSDGNRVPCETVYPTAEVQAFFG